MVFEIHLVLLHTLPTLCLRVASCYSHLYQPRHTLLSLAILLAGPSIDQAPASRPSLPHRQVTVRANAERHFRPLAGPTSKTTMLGALIHIQSLLSHPGTMQGYCAEGAGWTFPSCLVASTAIAAYVTCRCNAGSLYYGTTESRRGCSARAGCCHEEWIRPAQASNLAAFA
jgi:hypothetical protein